MIERKSKKIGEKTIEGKIVGRDKTIVPSEEVYKLAQIGCKNQEIADWFGIDENTLSYNFSEDITKGRENLKQSLRRAQLKLALSGNATMLIWLGKNMLGQSDMPVNAEANEPLPWSDDDLKDVGSDADLV